MKAGEKIARVGETGRLLTTASSTALPLGFCSRFLDGLTASQIKAVLGLAKQRTISRNQAIQLEGDPANHLYLLVTGLAAFYKPKMDGGRVFLRWLSPGDAFGLAALAAQPQPYLTTVQAMSEGSLLVWERVSALALLQISQLRENAYNIASDYLNSLADVLVARTSQTAPQRLARMLVESAHQIGQGNCEKIELAITNEQLAEMADVSLFTASRCLSEWQRQGILVKSRGKIRLCAPERLVAKHF